ncbi:MAG: GreA/GreB family elongation factor [Eubacteriales bacterium]|nr:GreA/GreB family elongation factor [Bacillota bacterium]MDP3050285.1 GreA/GreB family elongation factor [Eubacteriales bacterium]MDQ7788925.1 GreA/GreB family elongation factor [Clostridia bacterium]MDZ4042558.1 GreA/GreB family elongation factor [Eubacteriales bacterium]MDZ7610711.1 GreA/GreB family elongation factor [Eubacteriales bacterium]
MEVQDLSDQKVFKYRIVIPIHGSVRGGDVSYLSPMGKSLMLRRVGGQYPHHVSKNEKVPG